MKNNKPIALITGGSRGIGRSTALSVARNGNDVIITYHTNRAEADATLASIRNLGQRAEALPLDASDSRSFTAFSNQLRETLKSSFQTEQFEYLVNNAGTGLNAPITDTTEEDFDQLTNIHFKGVFFLTQTLLPLISDGGRIVNISSGLARFALPGSSAYAAVKGAVEVLSRYMAKEFAPRGITVNVLAPGAVATDFRGGAIRDNPVVSKHVAEMTALGRVGLPDDIGGAIALLLQPQSGWITGQRIEASGGMFI